MPPSRELLNAVAVAASEENERYQALQLAILEQQTLLAPSVVDIYGNVKPLQVAYRSLMEWLHKLAKDDPYRLEMVGAELIEQSPLELYLYQIRQRVLGFDQLPVWDQAGHIVAKQFENMQALLERHSMRQMRAKNEEKSRHAHQNTPSPNSRAKANNRRTPRRR